MLKGAKSRVSTNEKHEYVRGQQATPMGRREDEVRMECEGEVSQKEETDTRVERGGH